MTAFYKGLEVRYKSHVGFIYFVCEKYITVCINNVDQKSKDICLLVYSNQWKDVQLMKESEK